jgi:hypothetical protein
MNHYPAHIRLAAVQAWAPADRRARVIGACNVLSAAFMTVGGLGLAAHLSGAQLDAAYDGQRAGIRPRHPA